MGSLVFYHPNDEDEIDFETVAGIQEEDPLLVSRLLDDPELQWLIWNIRSNFTESPRIVSLETDKEYARCILDELLPRLKNLFPAEVAENDLLKYCNSYYRNSNSIFAHVPDYHVACVEKLNKPTSSKNRSQHLNYNGLKKPVNDIIKRLLNDLNVYQPGIGGIFDKDLCMVHAVTALERICDNMFAVILECFKSNSVSTLK
jgi:hypothetical protein